MASARTPWHRLFVAALRERAPPGFDVTAEVQLGLEPQRADIVLVRRPGSRVPRARPLLSRLWGRIRADALLELKTVARPIRRGDLARLLGYGAQYYAIECGRLHRCGDLLLVLVVASVTPTLELELARMGWGASERTRGYANLGSRPFPGMLIVIDEVARAEQDDLLRVFGHDKIEKNDTLSWLRDHISDSGEVPMQKLEGYDEVLRKLVEALPFEKRGSLLSPEERVAGLTAEQRLAGLPPEQQFAAAVSTLPAEVLRALPPEYVATLPEALRAAIARRLER
jgi:hypothetical protein